MPVTKHRDDQKFVGPVEFTGSVTFSGDVLGLDSVTVEGADRRLWFANDNTRLELASTVTLNDELTGVSASVIGAGDVDDVTVGDAVINVHTEAGGGLFQVTAKTGGALTLTYKGNISDFSSAPSRQQVFTQVAAILGEGGDNITITSDDDTDTIEISSEAGDNGTTNVTIAVVSSSAELNALTGDVRIARIRNDAGFGAFQNGDIVARDTGADAFELIARDYGGRAYFTTRSEFAGNTATFNPNNLGVPDSGREMRIGDLILRTDTNALYQVTALSGATSSAALRHTFSGGTGTTNLSVSRTATTVTVASSTGADATLPAASSSEAGVYPATDKAKVDGITAGAQPNPSDAEIGSKAARNLPTDLTSTEQATAQSALGLTATGIKTLYESNSGTEAFTSALKTKLETLQVVKLGTAGTDAAIAAARDSDLNILVMTADVTLSTASVYDGAGTALTGVTSGDLLVWDGTDIRWERAVNLPSEVAASVTNLTITRAADSVTVNSSTGTNAQIPAATTSEAGVYPAADKTKVDGIAANATNTEPIKVGTVTSDATLVAARQGTSPFNIVRVQNTFSITSAPVRDTQGNALGSVATGDILIYDPGDTHWERVFTRRTAAELKTLYESNADTNAFTTALLNKLIGIDAGANVNRTPQQISDALDALFGSTNWRVGGGGGSADVRSSGKLTATGLVRVPFIMWERNDPSAGQIMSIGNGNDDRFNGANMPACKIVGCRISVGYDSSDTATNTTTQKVRIWKNDSQPASAFADHLAFEGRADFSLAEFKGPTSRIFGGEMTMYTGTLSTATATLGSPEVVTSVEVEAGDALICEMEEINSGLATPGVGNVVLIGEFPITITYDNPIIDDRGEGHGDAELTGEDDSKIFLVNSGIEIVKLGVGHGTAPTIGSWTRFVHAKYQGESAVEPGSEEAGFFYYDTRTNKFRVTVEIVRGSVTTYEYRDMISTDTGYPDNFIGHYFNRSLATQHAEEEGVMSGESFTAFTGTLVETASSFTPGQDATTTRQRILVPDVDHIPFHYCEFWGSGQTERAPDDVVERDLTGTDTAGNYRFEFDQALPNKIIGGDIGIRALTGAEAADADLLTGETAIGDYKAVRFPAGVHVISLNSQFQNDFDAHTSVWMYEILSGADDFMLRRVGLYGQSTSFPQGLGSGGANLDQGADIPPILFDFTTSKIITFIVNGIQSSTQETDVNSVFWMAAETKRLYQ